MKLTPVGKINSEYKPNNNNQNKDVNFTGLEGVLDGCVKFWQTVDSFGRAGQFTVEDMCGTNFPRSYKGLMAGKKYTGKYNLRAFFQEATREFLTGPTMTIIPVLSLTIAKKAFGPSANTKVINNKNLSYLMEGIKEGTAQEVRDDFLTKVAKDMIESTLDGAKDKKGTIEEDTVLLKEALSKYADKLDDFAEVTRYRILPSKQTNAAKSAMKQEADNFAKVFRNIIKNSIDSQAKTDFETVKHTINNAGQKRSADVKNYAEYVASYIHDFTRFNLKDNNMVDTSKDAINKFMNMMTGKRAFVLLNMIILTGFLMSFIPKLYTRVSGKVNPNASGVYGEAEKRKGKKSDNIKETANA